MMKKRYFLTGLLVMAVVLTACGKEEDMYPSFSHLHIDSYLTDTHYGYNEEYAAIHDRIAENDGPAAVSCVTEKAEITEQDAELAVYAWDKVTRLSIQTAEADKALTQDGSVTDVRFYWEDGTEYSFSFLLGETEAYCADAGGKWHRVSEADRKLRPILALLQDYHGLPEDAADREPAVQDAERYITSGSFDWDADGDGQKELFMTEFLERGDSGDMAIYCVSGKEAVLVGLITCSEGIHGLEEGEDETGRWLKFRFTDVYYMEEYRCTEHYTGIIRYKDGKFDLELQ